MIETAENHYSFAKGVPYPLSKETRRLFQTDRPEIPKQYDFREKYNATISNIVQNQGQCGSCWAISAADCAAAYALKWTTETNNTIVNEHFSAQYLLDCDHSCQSYDAKDCQNGCRGGYSNLAFEFMKKNGIPNSECLPYKMKNDTCPATCVSGKSINYFTKEQCGFEPWVFFPGNSIRPLEDIQLILSWWGPAAVNYEVFKSFYDFTDQFKNGEVYTKNPKERKGTGEYHAVAIYGYGEKNGTNYWLVKNRFAHFVVFLNQSLHI
ncbi:putative Papain family cysteine protease [Monocercomonoides exilis]|uniref:putative Papain family cysteine protease n=1 Tax=Monocercomonoides exilis TaxID=2049356 RepID=UPI00355A5648|nr:putative Papain family cysteine protease [Monocercomonoides exilis]|eukprot:MONOS_799.1-p1 / transcript=MONOS_799.1 / gene=MONOS_799 / organism=Monocercomonoides_exilis_PA203 / gene_product=unspecified product / transcript_product=unspecified product / location=Mono_scaffold00013:153173-154457(+) / protein_length=265 / sequence_SO=supercontig / SO=protein_coding / is_pseudo=false